MRLYNVKNKDHGHQRYMQVSMKSSSEALCQPLVGMYVGITFRPGLFSITKIKIANFCPVKSSKQTEKIIKFKHVPSAHADRVDIYLFYYVSGGINGIPHRQTGRQAGRAGIRRRENLDCPARTGSRCAGPRRQPLLLQVILAAARRSRSPRSYFEVQQYDG